MAQRFELLFQIHEWMKKVLSIPTLKLNSKNVINLFQIPTLLLDLFSVIYYKAWVSIYEDEDFKITSWMVFLYAIVEHMTLPKLKRCAVQLRLVRQWQRTHNSSKTSAGVTSDHKTAFVKTKLTVANGENDFFIPQLCILLP